MDGRRDGRRGLASLAALALGVLVAAVLGLIGASHASAQAAGMEPVVTESGLVSLSVDAVGTNEESGTVQADKPEGATVRSAYLAAAQINDVGTPLADGDVTIDGQDVAWADVVTNGIQSTNGWANVTALVKPKLDAAAAGLVDFTITEASTLSVNGEVLAVIFDDPGQAQMNTLVLLFGSLATGGDTFAIGLAEPVDTSDPNLALDLGLGISHGFQGLEVEQYSQIDVKGVRLTTAAGGYDDGEGVDGALITAGGIGDSNTNPADPNALPDGTQTDDDELYSLVPFVTDGDTQIDVATLNPSDDDNIFFGAMRLNSTVAVVGEGIVLGPDAATNPINTPHTVTATVQDDNGQPVAGKDVTFTVLDGPNAGALGTVATGDDGKASKTYTSSVAGVDSIQASFVDSEDQTKTSNTVTKTWTDEGPGVTLALAPESAENPVGTQHTVTATLLDGDSPLEGVEVSFVVTGPNATSGTDTTDENGQATFTYTGTAAGTDTIGASASVDDTPVTSDTVTKTWTDEGPGVTLALAPESAENPLGTEHTVVATLLDGEAPLEGVEVSFEVSGANTTSGTDTTDAAGQASFTYTGAAAGTDSIVASATVEDTPVTSDTVTKTWTAGEAFDDVHLKALWGPAWNRSLAYENGGTLTAGDYVVDPDSGEPTSIDGTGTLPSSSGDGDATIVFHLTFDEGTNKWGGTVEIDDPGADFAVEIPVFAGPQRITRDGNRIEGTLYGIKKLSTPQKCFELHFVIVDNSGSTVEPPAEPEPLAEHAGGHWGNPVWWAAHERPQRWLRRYAHHLNQRTWWRH